MVDVNAVAVSVKLHEVSGPEFRGKAMVLAGGSSYTSRMFHIPGCFKI
jgi:hypothetical protein